MPTTERPQDDEGLVRALGVLALSAVTVNAIIGSGIFAMPGNLAGKVGHYAALMFVLGAIAMIPVTLCFAAAGSRVSRTGGVYAYVHQAFGPFPGYIGGALIWFSNLTAFGAVTAALADQARAQWPLFGEPAMRTALIVAVVGVLVAINAAGIRLGARALITFALLKLAPLLALILVGLFFVSPASLALGPLPPTDALGYVMLNVIFAYSGIETAMIPSGEVRDPARTVPRAAIIGMLMIVLVYVGIQTTAGAVLGDALAGSKTPLADMAGVLWGPGRAILLATTSVSMLGLLLGSAFGNSRGLYALARDGYLPSALASISARKVPLLALATYGGLGIVLAVISSFEKLVLVSTAAVCLGYIGVCLAAWKLERSGTTSHGAPFRLIGGPLIPLLGVALMIAVLTTLSRDEWLALAVALAILSALFVVTRQLSGRARG